MTDKLVSKPTQSQIPKKEEKAQNALLATNTKKSKDKRNESPSIVVRIDEKILELKKKKERIQIPQALLFMKEAQKIFKEDMSFNLAPLILSETWNKTSHSQKEDWQKRAASFCVSSFQKNEKKTPSIDPTPHQS